MMFFKNLLYSILFLACSVNAQNQFNQKNILEAEETFILNAQLTVNVIDASWLIAAEHYLYMDSIKVIINNEAIAHEFILLDESVINDEFFGESLVLQNTLVIRAVYNSTDRQNAIITIEYQGCAAGKYCYPKQRRNI